jgi:hypothetical protein
MIDIAEHVKRGGGCYMMAYFSRLQSDPGVDV